MKYSTMQNMTKLKMIHTLKNIPNFTLEEGYTLRFFQPGEEQLWLELCQHGLLDNMSMENWDTCITAFPTLVPERDLYFICDPSGKPVATTIAFTLPEGDGLLHMVAATPESRGHGLGYAMTVYGIQKLAKEGEAKLMRLNTDDFRKGAVKVYLRSGFQPVLYDEGMQERWQALCDEFNIHGVEMLDLEGNPTGIIL